MNGIKKALALIGKPFMAIHVLFSSRWINDTIGIAGLLLLTWGVGLIYLPLAPIIAGVVFLSLAIRGACSRKGGDDGVS